MHSEVTLKQLQFYCCHHENAEMWFLSVNPFERSRGLRSNIQERQRYFLRQHNQLQEELIQRALFSPFLFSNTKNHIRDSDCR